MIQWVEQKAIIIFLSLLHLGIKKINLGPKIPAFLTPNLVKYIVENFDITTMANNPFYMPPKPVIKSVPLSNSDTVEANAPLREFENTQSFEKYKLISKVNVGGHARIFTFALRNPKAVYALPPGKFVLIRY